MIIKIWFEGFWKDFNREDNFISEVLQKRYDIILDKQHPDFLFYSVFNSKFLKYDCVKIFYSGENITPDFNLCDYAIGFDHISFEDRYLRYPLWLLYLPYYCVKDENGRCVDTIERRDNTKESFCSFVYSNKRADKVREDFFINLSKYKQVDSGGKLYNNVGGPIKNKIEFESKHKFAIAFENVSQNGYTTEKIISAFASGAVPIYWGDPAITKDFNEKAFINCNGCTIDEMVHKVIEADQNQRRYEELRKESIFRTDTYISDKKKKLENFLYHIVEQSKDTARRNTPLYWKSKYEKKVKNGTLLTDLIDILR